jgi:hypothetical protein
MAIDIQEPAVKAPWPPREENDPLYRYPKPYPVIPPSIVARADRVIGQGAGVRAGGVGRRSDA